MKKNIKRKANPKDEKIKQEIKKIRKDLKRLKRSKKRMQLLWYRTKKEHVAFLKDLEQRLKALKRSVTPKKTKKKKPVVKNTVMKAKGKKALAKKFARKMIIKNTRKNIVPAKKK